MNTIVLAVLAFAFSSAYAEPSGQLLEPCQRNQENRKKLESARGEHVSRECKEQIKNSTKACMDAPAENDEEIKLMANLTVTHGSRSVAENQKQAYQMGHQRFMGHVQLCQKAMKEVDRVCNPEAEALKRKLHEVSEAKADPLQERERHQSSQAIQRELQELHELKNVAHKGMHDSHECSENYARIYQDALDKTSVTEEAASGRALEGSEEARVTKASYSPSEPMEESKVNPRGPSSEPESYRDKAERFAEKVVTKMEKPVAIAAATSAAKNIVSKKMGGAVTPGIHIAEQDGASTYSSTASYLAERFAKPSTALRVTGAGTFLTALFHSDPAGKCSEIYVDPIQAYGQGCSVSTLRGASANETAIASLNQP